MLIFILLTFFKNILAIPLLIRNHRLILTLSIAKTVPMTAGHERRETSLLAPGKTQAEFCFHSREL